jgi:AcrR family transcriptional regulator
MTEENRPALPPSMALAWGVGGARRRGPKRVLTIEQIVEAGTAIAVGDGIGALSMARVAERLGVSTMALYRYFAAKDDLLELMVDSALGLPPPAQPGETWRAGLRRWAEGVRDGYRANQWALRVPISAPPLGPNNVRWLENALAALRDTPLTASQKMSCVLTLVGFVRSEELLLADLMASQAAGRDPRDYAMQLAGLITAQDFPQVSAALFGGAMADEEDPDDDFEFGVECILDGIGVLIGAQRKRG